MISIFYINRFLDCLFLFLLPMKQTENAEATSGHSMRLHRACGNNAYPEAPGAPVYSGD